MNHIRVYNHSCECGAEWMLEVEITTHIAFDRDDKPLMGYCRGRFGCNCGRAIIYEGKLVARTYLGFRKVEK